MSNLNYNDPEDEPIENVIVGDPKPVYPLHDGNCAEPSELEFQSIVESRGPEG